MYFKDSNGGLHFLSDDDLLRGGRSYLSPDCVEIDDKEAEQIQKDLSTPAPEQIKALAQFEAQQYLNETNWYVMRKMETGEAIPDDIAAKRTKAYQTLV